jgi:hypothetical protein
LKAAALALPFEHPKLAVTATLGNGFAEQMKEIARQHYGGGNVIDAKPSASNIGEDDQSPVRLRGEGTCNKTGTSRA